MINDIFTCETEVEFLKNNYDLHAIDRLGRNALFTCSLEKTKWLVKHGININLLDCDLCNAMMNIPSNQLDKAHYLISIGVDLSIFITSPEKLSPEKIRSTPVSRIIQENIPRYLHEMTEKEKAKINSSLYFDKSDFEICSKKRRI
ncbi:MAG: hypothetical protein ACJ8LD_15765 [Pantoea agglomerans]